MILSKHVVFWLFAFMPAPSPIHVLCDLFFIAIFISITINHTTSLKNDTCFFEVFVGSSASLKVFLSFCLFFCQFQPGVVYKRAAFKKACISMTGFSHYSFLINAVHGNNTSKCKTDD